MDQQRIIQLVRDFAALHGRDISERLFQSLSGVSALDIQQHFSTWNKLRAAAGLASTDSAPPPSRTTRDDVLAAFQKALEKHGPRLTLQTFCQESGLSERVIYDRCGSWTKMRIDAGLTSRANAVQPAKPAPKPAPARQRITAEQILERLRAEVRRHGENISYQRFRQLTGFGPQLIAHRFGRWTELRRAAGLSPCIKIAPRFSHDDLLDDLLQVYQRTGGNPKMSRYRCDGGRISTVTIRATFGSWPQALAALHQHRLTSAAKE